MLDERSCKVFPDSWIKELNDKKDLLLEEALLKNLRYTFCISQVIDNAIADLVIVLVNTPMFYRSSSGRHIISSTSQDT